MFHSGLFNNPWHSWCSPNQLEDIQTVCQNDLFDDDMSSTSDPADHNTSTAAVTQPQTQMDTSSSSAHTQGPALALASFICSNLTLYAAKLYEKEEIINKLRKKVWQQGKPNNTVTSLQSDLKQKESELLGLQQALDVTLLCMPLAFPLTSEQQIQRGQEQTTQQYEMQFEELQRQFELNMQSQFNSLQATRMAEIDTHVQEEVTKLSSTLQRPGDVSRGWLMLANDWPMRTDEEQQWPKDSRQSQQKFGRGHQVQLVRCPLVRAQPSDFRDRKEPVISQQRRRRPVKDCRGGN
ncbi:hypothetical protein F5141DRAFT_1218494 [Pisolithus sp. B1]|nr:hypothetical protein F5141DRAFT_1218494 [Pisolithus sp. B1]